MHEEGTQSRAHIHAARHANVFKHVNRIHHASLMNVEAETPEKVAEEQQIVEDVAGLVASHACHRAASRDARPG